MARFKLYLVLTLAASITSCAAEVAQDTSATSDAIFPEGWLCGRDESFLGIRVCNEGLVCRPRGRRPSWTVCLPPGKVGEFCDVRDGHHDCAEGLHCFDEHDDGNGDGVCMAAVSEAGSPCADSLPCIEGLSCRPNEFYVLNQIQASYMHPPLFCLPPGQDGEYCRQGDDSTCQSSRCELISKEYLREWPIGEPTLEETLVSVCLSADS